MNFLIAVAQKKEDQVMNLTQKIKFYRQGSVNIIRLKHCIKSWIERMVKKVKRRKVTQKMIQIKKTTKKKMMAMNQNWSRISEGLLCSIKIVQVLRKTREVN